MAMAEAPTPAAGLRADSGAPDDGKFFRILSLDGGGIRGVFGVPGASRRAS
jgi:hypothetical protein